MFDAARRMPSGGCYGATPSAGATVGAMSDETATSKTATPETTPKWRSALRWLAFAVGVTAISVGLACVFLLVAYPTAALFADPLWNLLGNLVAICLALISLLLSWASLPDKWTLPWARQKADAESKPKGSTLASWSYWVAALAFIPAAIFLIAAGQAVFG